MGMSVLIHYTFILCLSLNIVLGATFSTNCGRSQNDDGGDPNWRIVGGTRAAKGEFPWQIQLNRVWYDQRTGRQSGESCGGSIINDKWILTAGHCTGGNNPQEYSVKLGIIDLRRSEGYRAGVSKVIRHDNFIMDDQTGNVRNDITLIKLDGSIDFTKYTDLEPICLANTSTDLTTDCVVSGYGLLNYNGRDGTQSSTLQKVSEPLTDDSRCTRNFPYFSSQQQVCAGGSARGGTGACMGDSGGPLQCKGSDGKYYQVGVVSFGNPCARANNADVFTKVSYFLDWIERTISTN